MGQKLANIPKQASMCWSKYSKLFTLNIGNEGRDVKVLRHETDRNK
jgi:hypothetical protein